MGKHIIYRQWQWECSRLSRMAINCTRRYTDNNSSDLRKASHFISCNYLNPPFTILTPEIYGNKRAIRPGAFSPDLLGDIQNERRPVRVLPRKEVQGTQLAPDWEMGVTLELVGPSALTQPSSCSPWASRVFLYGMWAPQDAVSTLRAETQWLTGFGVILPWVTTSNNFKNLGQV